MKINIAVGHRQTYKFCVKYYLYANNNKHDDYENLLNHIRQI
jgi:hypothetical protein